MKYQISRGSHQTFMNSLYKSKGMDLKILKMTILLVFYKKTGIQKDTLKF